MDKIINAVLESKGFDEDIETKTLKNKYFREVLFTTPNLQLVVMSVKDEIGMEIHEDTDQFIRVEGGKGTAVIDGREIPLQDGVSIIVPKGSKHNVVNNGKEDLKLYSIYSPPHHPAGTVHKTKEDAVTAESLGEAGFERNPKGWDKNSLKKYMNTFTKRMKGGVKAAGFFDKCVEKIKDKVENPEGFCASLKDEAYGSTGWRGKDKSPKEISKDIKKAKFKVEAEDAINDYLDFICESKHGGIIHDGAPLPNELITMLEYDERPNWIGRCFRMHEGQPGVIIKCLQAVKEYAAANPFYQYRIDRYIDRIMNNWENQSSEPYPTQNPDEREMNLGTTGRTYAQGYSNMDHEEPGIVEAKDTPCWKGYEMVGWKMKGGKKVPNCVPIKEGEEKENKPLNKPFRTPGGPKKFAVYVKNDKGNVVKVTFGDPNMEIKRDDPERRKSFRARHNCSNPGPKWKARYWSCYQWRAGANVAESEELLKEDFLAMMKQKTQKIKLMCKSKYPEDRAQRKACIKKYKNELIRGMEKKEALGMISKVPNHGLTMDTESGQPESHKYDEDQIDPKTEPEWSDFHSVRDKNQLPSKDFGESEEM